MGGHSVHLREESGVARDRGLVTIDVLPDNVLVDIFSYVNTRRWDLDKRNQWHALVHVCRRWRYLVFASPRRLNLQLEYGGHRPMSEVLGDWPVLPVSLILSVDPPPLPHPDQRWDNMVAVLESEHYNRICEINIPYMTNLRWERFAAAMQKPFPELTHLEVLVGLDDDIVSVLPDSFLGGSAPHLRTLDLANIPFPSIPKLLLSANALVTHSLEDIPDSGYFSPDAVATALTAMTRLESLDLQFRSPRSLPSPESRPLPPPTRFLLPALTRLLFEGAYEYLEDLLSRIDTPLLSHLYITFFMDLNFNVPQLYWLISHREVFKTFDHAEVLIFGYSITLSLHSRTRDIGHYRALELRILSRELEWQLSSLAQVCSTVFPVISGLEELKIREGVVSSHWRDVLEDAQWPEFLFPFTAVKNLYLTDEIARRVCGALQELSGERATDVLPALHNLFIDGFRSFEDVQETFRPFVAARQLSGHPVAIDRWQTQW